MKKHTISMVGFRPTSELHIGHFKSIIEPLMKNKNKMILFSAELHTLPFSSKTPGQQLHESRMLSEECLKTISRFVNLDPSKIIYISQYKMQNEHLKLHYNIISNKIAPSIIYKNPIYINTIKNEFIEYLIEKGIDKTNEIADIVFQYPDILIGGLSPATTNALKRQLLDVVPKETANQIILNIQNKNYANIGFAHYPILMTSDIILYEPDEVFLGIDQKPNVQIIHEIIDKLSLQWGIPIKKFQPKYTNEITILGCDGKKMSKSYKNTITIEKFIHDTEAVKHYYKKFLTYPRPKKSDPGVFNECPLSTHWKAFCENEKKHIEYVRSQCETANIGCMECKYSVIEIISEKIKPTYRPIQDIYSLTKYGVSWAKKRITKTQIYKMWNHYESFL